MRSVRPNVEENFGFAETQVVSFSDLYAGKIVAALDRQHPRDLFDIRDLLANEGISDGLRRAFIVYLISHVRPISEVMVPRRKDVRKEFEHGFEGMSSDPVSLGGLLKAREDLITEVSVTDAEGASGFLIGFKRGKPDWALLGVDGAVELPAVRWKQINLDKLRVTDDGRSRRERGADFIYALP